MFLSGVPEFLPWVWVLLVAAAFLIGVSKTALPGVATISIAIMASVMDAKTSTGVMLMLLIVGDMFAIWTFWKDANWRALVRLIPAVVVGLLLGVLFLAVIDDAWVKKVIGVILLSVVLFTLLRGRKTRGVERSKVTQRVEAASYGTLAGFTTTVANAGGPAMTMYFWAMKFEVKEFLGTAAWFFMMVNLAKLPFLVGLGIITWSSVQLDLLLIPAVVIGAFVGRIFTGRMSQAFFDRLVIILTILGSLYLIIF